MVTFVHIGFYIFGLVSVIPVFLSVIVSTSISYNFLFTEVAVLVLSVGLELVDIVNHCWIKVKLLIFYVEELLRWCYDPRKKQCYFNFLK